MAEESTTQFKTEGTPFFPQANEGEGTAPADPSPANAAGTGQTQSSDGGQNADATKKDGDAGFADHPRWKERESDWANRFNDQEKRHTEETAKMNERFERMEKLLEGRVGKSEVDQAAESPQIPEWFLGDAKQWKQFSDWHIKTAEEKAEARASKIIADREAKSGEHQKLLDEATAWFEQTVGVLEADKALNPKGEKIDRNKLLKFVMDNELVDTKGRWNYRAGYQMMKGLEAADPSRAAAANDRREIAAATIADGRSNAPDKNVATSETFKDPSKRPW